MAWIKTYHDQCTLPTPDDVTKHRIKAGSLWRCSTPGCNEVWMYEGGTKFTPMEEKTEYQPKTTNRSEEDDRVVPQPQVHQATAIGVGAGVELRAILEQRTAAASRVLEEPSQPTVDERPIDPPATIPPPTERKRTTLRDVRCACTFVDWMMRR